MNNKYSAAYLNLEHKFQNNECVVLDGAIATELQALSNDDFRLSDAEHWGFKALQRAPDTVSKVHASYVEAGCDVITTNTYGILQAPREKISEQAAGSAATHWLDYARTALQLSHGAIESASRLESCATAFSIGGDVASKEDLRTLELLLRVFSEQAPDVVLFETLLMIRTITHVKQSE